MHSRRANTTVQSLSAFSTTITAITPTKSQRKAMRHKKRTPWLFLAPNISIFAIFVLLPCLCGVVLSFFYYDGLATPSFAGLENYSYLFADDEFLASLFNSIAYTAIMVPLLFIVSLYLALILVKKIPFKGLFRALIYWPTMISYIVVGFSWKWLLSDETGLINAFITSFGLNKVPWLTDSHLALICIIFVTLWCRVGFFMIIFIGGLQSIPDELIDAARIDGATKRQVFWNIIFPLLRPTSVMVFILATIDSFKAYAIVYSLTGGGPAGSTTFLVQYIFDTAFTSKSPQFGYASAVSVVLFIILGSLTFIQFKMTKGEES